MSQIRRFRVTLECDVPIEEVSVAVVQARHDAWLRDRIAEGWIPDLPLELPSEQQIQDLRILQNKLMSTPAFRDAWLKHHVETELDVLGLELPERMDSEENRVLRPVIEALPPMQRHRFREAVASSEFYDIADPFYQCFGFKIQSMEVADVTDEDAKPR